MGRKRFKRLGKGSFFGDLVYNRAVPDSHFLRQLERGISWQVFSERLIRLCGGQAEEGRLPYDPVVILKMLLLAYRYDLSERQAEAYVNDSLSAKCLLQMLIRSPRSGQRPHAGPVRTYQLTDS